MIEIKIGLEAESDPAGFSVSAWERGRWDGSGPREICYPPNGPYRIFIKGLSVDSLVGCYRKSVNFFEGCLREEYAPFNVGCHVHVSFPSLSEGEFSLLWRTFRSAMAVVFPLFVRWGNPVTGEGMGPDGFLEILRYRVQINKWNKKPPRVPMVSSGEGRYTWISKASGKNHFEIRLNQAPPRQSLLGLTALLYVYGKVREVHGVVGPNDPIFSGESIRRINSLMEPARIIGNTGYPYDQIVTPYTDEKVRITTKVTLSLSEILGDLGLSVDWPASFMEFGWESAEGHVPYRDYVLLRRIFVFERTSPDGYRRMSFIRAINWDNLWLDNVSGRLIFHDTFARNAAFPPRIIEEEEIGKIAREAGEDIGVLPDKGAPLIAADPATSLLARSMAYRPREDGYDDDYDDEEEIYDDEEEVRILWSRLSASRYWEKEGDDFILTVQDDADPDDMLMDLIGAARDLSSACGYSVDLCFYSILWYWDIMDSIYARSCIETPLSENVTQIWSILEETFTSEYGVPSVIKHVPENWRIQHSPHRIISLYYQSDDYNDTVNLRRFRDYTRITGTDLDGSARPMEFLNIWRLISFVEETGIYEGTVGLFRAVFEYLTLIYDNGDYGRFREIMERALRFHGNRDLIAGVLGYLLIGGNPDEVFDVIGRHPMDAVEIDEDECEYRRERIPVSVATRWNSPERMVLYLIEELGINYYIDISGLGL